jgi:hypothetical protein
VAKALGYEEGGQGAQGFSHGILMGGKITPISANLSGVAWSGLSTSHKPVSGDDGKLLKVLFSNVLDIHHSGLLHSR